MRILGLMRPAGFLLTALLLLGSGCVPGSPDRSHAPLDRFAGAYAGLLETSGGAGVDSLARERSIDSVLAAHGIDRAGFQASVTWCNEDVHRWREVMEEVVRRLEQKQSPTPTGGISPGRPGGPS